MIEAAAAAGHYARPAVSNYQHKIWLRQRFFFPVKSRILLQHLTGQYTPSIQRDRHQIRRWTETTAEGKLSNRNFRYWVRRRQSEITQIKPKEEMIKKKKLSFFMLFTCRSVCVRIVPDCPGGGIPDGTLGRYSSTVRTPALLPQHGSMAIGFGTACKHTHTHTHTHTQGGWRKQVEWAHNGEKMS